jgi:hypothetical protein
MTNKRSATRIDIVELLRFPNKALRAQAIKAYMQEYGYERAICFSCGNASKALKDAGVDTLDISAGGDMQALRWFTIGEIKQRFPTYFDATSGHLPVDCMQMVADIFKDHLHTLPNAINVPTGSGETLVCLKMAFPDVKMTAVYNLDNATKYEKGAPLNGIVKILADNMII